MSARLIAFEGIGGSGKTTVAGRIAAWLRREGIDVVETKEPGGTRAGTAAGKVLRAILLTRTNLDPLTQTLGFELDRALTSLNIVRPALGEGKWVVSDRHHFGTIAYQVYGEGVDLALVDTLSEAALGGRYPDRTFVLDLPVEVARGRPEGRTGLDVFDAKGLGYQERVRQGFLFAAGRRSAAAVVIDATQPLDEVLSQVQRCLVDCIGRPGPIGQSR